MKSNQELVVDLDKETATNKAAYADALKKFLEFDASDHSVDERVKALTDLHLAALAYFNFCENLVGSSDLLGAHSSDPWVQNFSGTCLSVLDTVAKHYSMMRTNLTKCQKSYPGSFAPSAVAYESMESVVAEFRGELTGPLKDKFVELSLPIVGFSPSARKKWSKGPNSPWASGSFYLLAFILLMVLIIYSVSNLGLLKTIPIVILGWAIFVTINAFQLKNDDRVSEKGFLELLKMSNASLFRLRKEVAKEKDDVQKDD